MKKTIETRDELNARKARETDPSKMTRAELIAGIRRLANEKQAECDAADERAALERDGVDPLVDDDARDLVETMKELNDLLLIPIADRTPYQVARIGRLTAIRDRKRDELEARRVRLCREAGIDPDGADNDDRDLTVEQLERKLADVAATADDDDPYDCARRDRLRDLINEKLEAIAACAEHKARETARAIERKAARVRKADAALPDYRAAVARVLASDKFAPRLREPSTLSGRPYINLALEIVNAVMIDLRRGFAARTLDQQVAAIEVDKAIHGAPLAQKREPIAVRPKLERVEIDHTGDFMTVRSYWDAREYGPAYGETLHIVGFMSRDLFAIAGNVPRVYHTPTFEDNTGLLRIDVDLAFRTGDTADEQVRSERREKAAAVVMVSVRMYETVFKVQAGQVRVV